MTRDTTHRKIDQTRRMLRWWTVEGAISVVLCDALQEILDSIGSAHDADMTSARKGAAGP